MANFLLGLTLPAVQSWGHRTVYALPPNSKPQ